MLKLCRVTEVKVLFLVLVYVFNFNLFEFSAAILEKGLLTPGLNSGYSAIVLWRSRCRRRRRPRCLSSLLITHTVTAEFAGVHDRVAPNPITLPRLCER